MQLTNTLIMKTGYIVSLDYIARHCIIPKHLLLFLGTLLFVIVAAVPLLAQSNSPRWTAPQNISSLNTAEDDFAPVWNKDESLLYYNSIVKSWSQFFTAKENDTTFFEKLQLQLQPQSPRGFLNKPSNNQAYITFFGEDEAFIGAYSMNESRSYLNIFRSYKRKNSWTPPQPLDSLECDCFCSHPTVSPNGEFLVYVSDRGLRNETDLWIAYRQSNGSYGASLRINEINTDGNEITPFLASKDTLFFASNGYGGPGGYDVYFSVLEKGRWSKPFPVSDINTAYDESDFCLLPNGDCVFASNRPEGKGKLDLYYAKANRSVLPKNIIHKELELNLALQAPLIKLFADLSLIRSVPNRMLNCSSIMQIIHTLSSQADFSESNATIYDRLTDDYSMLVIADRLKNNSNLSLELQCSASCKNSADSLAKALTDNGVSAAQVSVNLNANENQDGQTIALASNDEELFRWIDVYGRDYSIEPAQLNLSLSCRPIELLRRWECFLQIKNNRTGKIGEGTSLPSDLNVDITPYSSKLSGAEIIDLFLWAEDTLGNARSEQYSVPVVRSERRSRKVSFKDKSLIIFTLPLDESNLITKSQLQQIIDECKSKCSIGLYCNSIDKKEKVRVDNVILELKSIKPNLNISSNQNHEIKEFVAKYLDANARDIVIIIDNNGE